MRVLNTCNAVQWGSGVRTSTYAVGVDVLVEVALEVYDGLEAELIQMSHHAAAAEIRVIHAHVRRVYTAPPRNHAQHGLDIAIRALGRLKVVVEVCLKGPLLRQRRLVRVLGWLGGTLCVRCRAPLLAPLRSAFFRRHFARAPRPLISAGTFKLPTSSVTNSPRLQPHLFRLVLWLEPPSIFRVQFIFFKSRIFRRNDNVGSGADAIEQKTVWWRCHIEISARRVEHDANVLRECRLQH